MIPFVRRVLGYVRPYRGRLVLGLLSGVLFALFNAMLPVTIQLVVDVVFAPSGTASLRKYLEYAPACLRQGLESVLPDLYSAASPAALLLVIATIPGIMLARGVFNYLNVYLTNWVGVRAVADLRIELFGHLQSLSSSFFGSASTGELMSRLGNDVAALQNTISSSLAVLIKDPITVLALFIGLVTAQPRLTLVSLLVFPVCVVPVVVYGRKVRKSTQALYTHTAELTSLMHESFTGNRIIKAYNLEDRVLDQYRATNRKHLGQLMRVVRAQEIPSALIEFFAAVGVALVILYVKFLSDAPITAGVFFKFVITILLLYQPIKSISRLHSQLEQSRAAGQRVFELLDTPNTIHEPAQPVPLRAANAPIHFDNVCFSYGDKLVLHGIQLTVRPGQIAALVGASGSGKTTLTNLLLRFYDPQKGAVRIGDTDIRSVTTRDLRGQIAVVTQETILFNDTVRNNIALGRPGANNGEIEEAAKHAFAHEFIMEKVQGYDSLIGEKGVNLSGGQRQRIAIARAVLKNAPILVLDEATSALDTESERAVQAALEDLMSGRTTICIAHRLSTVQKADLIVVLDQGRIVETGTHAELIKRNGIYRKLYELQFQS